jgi:hypothetical protein
MAQKAGKQTEWPRVKREPDAYTLSPDVYLRTDRPVAELRDGTVKNGVGPRGTIRQETCDYGQDHIPREFDPIGSSLRRYQSNREFALIADKPAPRTDRQGSGSGRPTKGPRPKGAD